MSLKLKCYINSRKVVSHLSVRKTGFCQFLLAKLTSSFTANCSFVTFLLAKSIKSVSPEFVARVSYAVVSEEKKATLCVASSKSFKVFFAFSLNPFQTQSFKAAMR